MPLSDALLPEFDHEMSVTRRLLERVPEDRLDWKPHEKSYSLGQLAQHVATVPLWGSITLTRSELDVAGTPPLPAVTSRAELLDLFDRHVSDTRAALDGKTDAELMAPWTLKSGAHVVFTMPKASVWRSFVISHLIHHRGQLSVYLRMHDVPLPSIYGPSADEQ
jgi:uncharacterized damage-inducible protein DinB